MGYVEKKVLFEHLSMDSRFSATDINILDKHIKADKIRDHEAVMDSEGLSQIEAHGIREKFFTFCDENNWFQDWVRNAKKGID